jgi:hypothetical protein
MRWLLETDPGDGRMGVEDPNSAAEAPFHKFLAVDAAPTAWMCTAVASGLAFVQARPAPGAAGARRGRATATPARVAGREQAAALLWRLCARCKLKSRATARVR